jgi:hypothetical protein
MFGSREIKSRKIAHHLYWRLGDFISKVSLIQMMGDCSGFYFSRTKHVWKLKFGLWRSFGILNQYDFFLTWNSDWKAVIWQPPCTAPVETLHTRSCEARFGGFLEISPKPRGFGVCPCTFHVQLLKPDFWVLYSILFIFAALGLLATGLIQALVFLMSFIDENTFVEKKSFVYKLFWKTINGNKRPQLSLYYSYLQ